MASTNKTTNYDLSQYVGTDKPTYLGDYNSDMLKIDTQMKTNADNIATAISGIESATTTANQANTTAGQANTTAQSANTTAQSANTTANNAQSTANSALSTATTAQSKANEVETDLNAFESKFNLTSFKTYAHNSSEISFSAGNSGYSGSLTIATNEDKSIFKIYGLMSVIANARPFTLTLNNTGITVDEPYTISTAGVMFAATAQQVVIDITNNQMIIKAFVENTSSTTVRPVFLFPCVYFNKDFGDQPTTE